MQAPCAGRPSFALWPAKKHGNLASTVRREACVAAWHVHGAREKNPCMLPARGLGSHSLTLAAEAAHKGERFYRYDDEELGRPWGRAMRSSAGPLLGCYQRIYWALGE